MARNPHFQFLMGLLLLSCLAAMADAKYAKYKDPKQPLNVRINDLLSQMTLEEKIGQMVQIDRTVATAKVLNKYFIGNNHYHYYSLFAYQILVNCIFREQNSILCR